MRSVRAVILLGLLALSLESMSCADRDSAPRAYRYQDLLSRFGSGAAKQVACEDFTRLATRVPPGQPLAAAVAEVSRAKLVLRACARGADGRLDIVFRTRPGAGPERLAERSTPTMPSSSWSEYRIEVPEWAAGVEVHARGAAPIHLSDLYLRRPAAPVASAARGASDAQLLLVSADTLRTDAFDEVVVGTDDEGGGLASLPREAEVFERHYAGDHWTKPSHATLLTGQPVAVHGAAGRRPIAPTVVTLAERFRDGGFRTAGVATKVAWMDAKFGFGRGFESYRLIDRDGEAAVRHAVEWMAEHRDEPFFFFLHLFDSHSDFMRLPYEAPGTDRDTVAHRFGLTDYGCRDGRCASLMLLGIRDGLLEPLAGEAEALRFLYDRGVGHLRNNLTLLVEQLRAHRMWNDMTVVLTSDHGEEFLEHESVLHEQPYEEVLRVPLLVKWAGGQRAGRRHPGPSSALDVGPTILDTAGLPSEALPGHVLHRRPRRAPVTGGSSAKFRYLITAEHLKLIDYAADDRPTELYDLGADPGESRDLAPSQPEIVARLEELLERSEVHHVAAARRQIGDGGGAVVLTAEERARLRALGY